ncbi:MAG: DUF2971 domain-containing protein [Oscillospiraceae bacterium]|jgi:hypothetical protein
MAEKLLYHYCSNQSGLSILKHHTIRLSDIRKTNDYREMELFYPEIFDSIFAGYKLNPFPFLYNGKQGEEALQHLIQETRIRFESGFLDGSISNFVACFSEHADMLGQWRGYADDGRGICLGFSQKQLKRYIAKNDGIMNLVKVKYLTKEEIHEKREQYAQEALRDLRSMTEWLVENMLLDMDVQNADTLLAFNFSHFIEWIITDSLQYKIKGFREEKEWRIYILDSHYKVPEWIYLKSGTHCRSTDITGVSETLELLNTKMDFHITDHDLIAYFLLPLNDVDQSVIRSIRLGPNNQIRERDLQLYLRKYGFDHVAIHRSELTYR